MKIIAHRGASGYAPENTIAAFEKAIAMKATAIEFDVQMTKDGQLVVIHDFYVDRVSGGNGLVMNLTYEELLKLDAGSWFDQSFSGERIPLLEDVLDLIPANIEIHVEIKKPMIEKRDLAGAVYKMVESKGKLGQVLFSSFDHQLLLELQKYENVRFGVLVGSNLVKPIDYLKSGGLNDTSINIELTFASKELVEAAHQDNLLVYVYTVNDKFAWKYCKEVGIDGIFTNYVDLMDE